MRRLKHALRATTVRHLHGALWFALAGVLLLTACNPAPSATPTLVPTAEDEYVEGELITMTPPPGKMSEQQNYAPSDPALVGKTGRPQVIVFYAQNCAPCQQVRPLLFEAQDELGTFTDFLYLDADADATKAIRDQLQAGADRPLMVFIDANGNQVGRLVGSQPKEKVREMIDIILTVG
jgi:thiol-disulfide isomerase/thioredoxin